MNIRCFQKWTVFTAVITFALSDMAVAQDSKPAQASPTPATPATTGAGDSVDKTVDKFFNLLTKGQVDDAYVALTNGTKLGYDLEWLAKVKVGTKAAIQRFGDIQGYELVGVQAVGTHLIRATYLSLGKDSPLRWKFYFYRQDKTWKLIDLGVDDRLFDIFDEKQPAQQQQQSPGIGQ